PPYLHSFPTRRSSDLQPPPGAEIVERRDGGQHEPARELTALGFGRGEHRRLVQQGARVDELPARLEIQHGRSGGHVVKERRPGRDRKSTRLNSSHEWI